MKKSIKTVLAGLLVIPVIALGLGLFTPMTTSVNAQACGDGTLAGGALCSKSTNTDTPGCLLGENCVFTTIVNVALYIIGAVSVLMLIYGGIRYTMSGGDTAAVTAAKSTIMYAVIGVVVALLAYAIVNFVLVELTKTS